MDDPLETEPKQWMVKMDEIFLLIYIIEAGLKIMALG